MYYDYLYMLALYTHKEYWEYLENYKYFTDVFFNSCKQINTQARAAAIFKTFLGNTDFLEIMENSKDFKDYYKKIKILHKWFLQIFIDFLRKVWYNLLTIEEEES